MWLFILLDYNMKNNNLKKKTLHGVNYQVFLTQ